MTAGNYDMRACGSCSLCCKVMGVPEVKSRHDWCPHVDKGKGCKIYDARPDRCREFSCLWLTQSYLDEARWFPLTSRIVVDLRVTPDASFLCFVVDPAYPLRAYEEPYASDIAKLAVAGISGSTGNFWHTVLLIKDATSLWTPQGWRCAN